MTASIKPGYKLTEVGVIPEDWEVTRLDQCGIVVMGQSPPSATYNRVGQGSPLLNGPSEFTDKSPVKVQWTTSPARFCNPGDLLICVRGSSTGRTNISNDVYAIGRGVAAIRAVQNNSTKYLSYQVIQGVDEILKAATGTTFPSVDGATFRKISILLPSTLAEQEAIANALSDADMLIESLEQLVAKKRRIKQGAMQELLTGQKRLPGFSGKWEVKRLGELGESLIGLTYKPTDVRENGILVLRSSNVFEGDLRFEDNVFVKMDIPEKIMVKPGDILICVRNGSRDLIGKCAKIDERAKGMTFGAFMAVFRTRFNNYIYHQFQSDAVLRQIHEHLGATINQITNRSLNSFQVPIPSDESEQHAIAAILSDMDAEIAGLEAKLAKSRQVKQGMMQELLTGRIRLI